MDSLAKDVRYAIRGLRRSPGFTAAVVLSLGLGTGGATAIFSVVNGVILRPLPYPEPQRLVMLWETNAGKALDHDRLSPVNFLDYRALGHAFADAAAWWSPEMNLTDPGQEPVRVSTVEASRNFFGVMGVQPVMGHGFVPGATLHDTGTNEVVISHRLWQNRYHADPAIVDRVIRLDGRPFTVLGVMPPGFHFPANTDVWQRLEWDLSQHSRAAHFMEAVARLHPGVSIDQAQRELTAVTRRLAAEFAGTNGGWSVRAVALNREVIGFFRPALFVLLGAVGLLLLVACANIANLLLARASARSREVAIRAALGATGRRLVRQFVIESLVLACTSSALGLVIAYGTIRMLVLSAPIDIPRLDEVSLDARVLGFSSALAVLTALAFGLAPALLSSRPDMQHAMKEGGRSATAGRAGRRARSALVVAEVALAVVLLVGAGLLIRSFARLLAEETGFRTGRTLTASLQLPASSYPDWPQVQQFYRSLLSSLRAHPAVDAAAAGNFLPFTPGWRMEFAIAGRPRARPGDEPTAQYHSVSDDYFRVMSIPLQSGRTFTDRDTDRSPGVAIVNRAFAQQQFSGQDPIGHRIRSSSRVIGPMGRVLLPELQYEIVGVVADVKNTSLQSPPEPAIYCSDRQFPFRAMHVLIRGGESAADLPRLIREAVKGLDPSLPISDLRTMDQFMADTVEQPRFLMVLMTAFAALALLLAGLGIYGVLSYAVTLRRQEIGIRMALGARPADVIWLVTRESVWLAVVGGAIGTAGAILLGRAVSSLLFGVRPTDVATFAAVLILMLGVAVVACIVPARRASGVDPLAGLRAD